MINSTKTIARTGGVLYLIIIVVGIFGEIFVRDRLIVSDDATATANNIVGSQFLWRIGIASQIMMLVCAVALALILYNLLRPVSRNIAMLAAFFNLISISIEALIKLSLFAALFLVGDANYLKAFEPTQLHALAFLSIKLHSSGYNISLLFFGFNCIFWGYLLYYSPYFSKILGILLVVTGICYIINSLSWFLVPTFASKIYPAILIPCLIGELALTLWLLIKGVRLPKKIQ